MRCRAAQAFANGHCKHISLCWHRTYQKNNELQRILFKVKRNKSQAKGTAVEIIPSLIFQCGWVVWFIQPCGYQIWLAWRHLLDPTSILYFSHCWDQVWRNLSDKIYCNLFRIRFNTRYSPISFVLKLIFEIFDCWLLKTLIWQKKATGGGLSYKQVKEGCLL